MTGVSPLAKGPPPLVRLENTNLGKKSSSNGRVKAAEKTSSKTPLHEDTPATKQPKLMPTSFDNKYIFCNFKITSQFIYTFFV